MNLRVVGIAVGIALAASACGGSPSGTPIARSAPPVASAPSSDSVSQYVGNWVDGDVGGTGSPGYEPNPTIITESNGILSIKENVSVGYNVFSVPDTSNGSLKFTRTYHFGVTPEELARGVKESEPTITKYVLYRDVVSQTFSSSYGQPDLRGGFDTSPTNGISSGSVQWVRQPTASPSYGGSAPANDYVPPGMDSQGRTIPGFDPNAPNGGTSATPASPIPNHSGCGTPPHDCGG